MQTRSRGFAINYESVGTRPPVMLVPGTLSSAAQWELFGYTRALGVMLEWWRSTRSAMDSATSPMTPWLRGSP
ncbi:MAG: hypothetical protein ACRDNK_23670 [Solirubrobacteraceae bacterium]